MQLINATRMLTAYTLGVEPSGRERLVVVVKGSFRFPREGEPAQHFALHEEQQPLVMADTFTGEPGFSAPVYEAEFAYHKPRCDILLLGSAHAPNGRMAKRVEVGVRVGGWQKQFAVVGPRHWDCGAATLRASAPEPFAVQPISYDVAFGGVDHQHDDPAQHAAYLPNPVGRGFHKHLKKAWVDGKPLPATEELSGRVSDPGGNFRPMAFGPIGRGWEARFPFAGTYDEGWLETNFPFLPPDFDLQYFQSAPADQQVPLGFFKDGPTEVLLSNLTPQGITRFTIPQLVAPVTVFPRKGGKEEHLAELDTVVIEPDEERFTLTWRMSRPLKKNIFEIGEVLVGKKGREWWQQREELAFPIPVVMVPAEPKETPA